MTRAAASQRRWVGTLAAVSLLVASCSTAGTPVAATGTPTAVLSTTATSTTATSTTATSGDPSLLPSSSSPASPTTLEPLGLNGVNDPDCTSQSLPVVLLHGTFASVSSNYAALAAALQAAGRCVYGIDYGRGGVQSVRTSAQEVTAFVDLVLTVTGAEQVDVVAYSQGGLVLRAALRLNGLAPDVATAVLIAPTFHGSTSPLLSSLPAGICAACTDQAAGSPLLAELDAGNTPATGDLDGDVRYAVISSLDDTIVTPTASQVPLGPPDRVRSLVVQDQCPGKYLDHVALPADRGVISWTVDALNTAGAPDPSVLTCG